MVFEVTGFFDADSMNRATDPKYAAGFQTAFTDGFPILMISQVSIDNV
jgi:uncharacterized protein YcbX